ncbi:MULTISPECIES: staphylopine family metallophore export MFS transporter CntE [Brevibacillus]|uniref:staphylopine family metallophore export MFS transporter CntE n=1 Tax=Brevibacillus TaxID=55080 RepID=UPI00156A7EF2|nr:MFS transporter [Brevibacillus parabrevis]MDR5001566.1 MFS transporter [Brevibacillus parabrevis]NRQ56363.1 MFS transporter [Brevibacillus sp. HD1.4A]WDV95745.1 MFS transporter [Brevibacillus parabrevis]
MKGALAWPFLRLYVLTLFYFSANSILNVIIPLQGSSLGASNTTIGIVMGAYLFTTMLLRPWAGHIIQKRGPIKVLRTILVLNGAALILYTFTGLEGYFVARMLQGVCTAFFSMALQLGIIDALPEKERSQGISMYSLCAYLPGIVGPLLALGIWQPGEMGSFAVTMIAIAILTGVVGFTAKIDDPSDGQAGAGGQGQANANGKAETFSAFGPFFKNPHLLACSVLMLTSSLVFGAVTAFIPLYALQIAGGHAGVFLMLQAGTVVLARFVLRKKIPSDGKWRASFIMGVMLILAVAAQSVSLSAAGGFVFFYVGAVLMGIAQALLYPTLTTYLTFVLPQASRNVLIGLFIATADLGVSLGGIIMGPVADLSSYSFMYMLCALLGVAMTLFAYERRKALTEAEAA